MQGSATCSLHDILMNSPIIHHKNPPPTVVLETGTLLTLLLGGEKYQSGFAYATLLHDMAKKDLIRLVIPDMVLMEVLGTQSPVYAKDIF